MLGYSFSVKKGRDLKMRIAVMVAVILSMAVTLILPSSSQASASRELLTSYSTEAISEGQFLKVLSDVYPTLYKFCPLCTKSPEVRQAALRQAAEKGFDPKMDNPLYETMLPNSATLSSVQTWFGHPVEKTSDGNFIIKGWFTDGDAKVIPAFPDMKYWEMGIM